MTDFIKCDIVIESIDIVIAVNPYKSRSHHSDRPNHGIVWYVSGNTVYKFPGGVELNVEKGGLLYLPEKSTYDVTVCENFLCYAINYRTVNPDIFEPFVMDTNNFQLYNELFKKAEAAWISRSPDYRMYVMSLLYDILYQIKKEYRYNNVPDLEYKKIKDAVDFIEMNYYKKSISVTQLANLSDMSEVTFRKIFNDIYGIPPVKYINNLRISRAADLIRSQMYSVHDAAVMSGFNDESYFSRAFKKHMGLSPADYKKSH